jgi:hypothetical protein
MRKWLVRAGRWSNVAAGSEVCAGTAIQAGGVVLPHRQYTASR